MSNSDYEDREMAYLTEIWTDSELYERSGSNPEDQEEDHDDKESPETKTKGHPPNEWARWIETTETETEESIKKHRAEIEKARNKFPQRGRK